MWFLNEISLRPLALPRASGEPPVSLEARGIGEQKANSEVTLKIKGSFGYPQGKVEGERSPVHQRAHSRRARGSSPGLGPVRRPRSPEGAEPPPRSMPRAGCGSPRAVRRHRGGFDTKLGGSEQRAPAPSAAASHAETEKVCGKSNYRGRPPARPFTLHPQARPCPCPTPPGSREPLFPAPARPQAWAREGEGRAAR